MPTQFRKDKDGCYAQWGDHGKKYRYTCGNKKSKHQAKAKADRQGRAAHASGYKIESLDLYKELNLILDNISIVESEEYRYLQSINEDSFIVMMNNRSYINNMYKKSFKENIKLSLLTSSIVTASLFLFKWLMTLLTIKIQGKKIFNKRLTNKVRNIIENDKIEIYKIDNETVNAFNMGSKKLYYYDGLVKKLKLTEDELIAIMIHEYGHYEGKHVLKHESIVVPSHFICSFIVALLFGNKELTMTNQILWQISSSMIPGVIYNVTLGRKFEYYSDSFAKKYGYGKQLESALGKMQKYFIYEICEKNDIIPESNKCKNIISSMHKLDEHPEFEDRLAALRGNNKVKKLSHQLKKLIYKTKPILKKIM